MKPAIIIGGVIVLLILVDAIFNEGEVASSITSGVSSAISGLVD